MRNVSFAVASTHAVIWPIATTPLSKVNVARGQSAKLRQSHPWELTMTAATLNGLIPSAADLRKKIALAEAEKASAMVKKRDAAEAEKRELLDRLAKPSGVPDEERLKRAASIIQRAVEAGLTEVFVGRFPNSLCTDHGRAINQQEPGWENTLTGLPKELYQFWAKYLQPQGYRLRCQIVDWPEGMPGDVGITLVWG
jgi:hypothetical protein